MHVCSVAQSCPTLCNPVDYGPTGASAHGISQARILEGVAIFYSKGSSQNQGLTHCPSVLCIGRLIVYHWCYRLIEHLSLFWIP